MILRKKILNFLLIFGFCILQNSLFAQNFIKIDKYLKQNNLSDAKIFLDKSRKKYPQNAGISYHYGIFFLKTNSKNLATTDSANVYFLQALDYFRQTDFKTRKKLAQNQITEKNILIRKNVTDSLAFSIIVNRNQIADYQYFISRFVSASQIPMAVEKRNELAFQQAFQAESPDNLRIFIEKYPNALQILQAKQRYETLIFESQTSHETLAEFSDFLRQNPDSPYRQQAEKNIFQLATLPHTLEIYKFFLSNFAENSFRNVARQHLYNLFNEKNLSEDFFTQFSEYEQDIDWKLLIAENEMILYPVLEDEKYGFMQANGNLKISPKLDSVAIDYFCEGITENAVKFFKNRKAGLLNKSGKEMVAPVFEDILPLETGLLKTLQNGKYGIIHEIGFEVLAPVFDSVAVLGEKLLISFRNGKAQIFSRNGKKLLETENQNIKHFDDSLLIIRKDEKLALLPYNQLFTLQSTVLKFDYDKAEISGNQYLNLVKDSTEYLVFSQKNTIAQLLDTSQIAPVQLKLKEKFPKVQPTGNFFLVITQTKKIGLFAANGEKIISPKYEAIEIWENDYFKVKQNGNFGLMDRKEKWLVKPEFDGLENLKDGYIATLKNTKFGLQTLDKKVMIIPQYEALIQSYDAKGNYLLTRKDEKIGFINAENQQVTGFIFDEVRFWQPSVALVRIGGFWHLYDIPQKRFTYKAMEEIIIQQASDDEQIIRIYSEKKYGLLSNKRGVLADAEYNALTNIGTPEKPFYLAEKSLREVEVYLLYYLDASGKIVRRQALNQQLYEKISCD